MSKKSNKFSPEVRERAVRKLNRFLSKLKDVPLKERVKLLQKYPDGSPEQHDLGENLLLALDRMDSVQKPVVLARFFTAYVADQLDYLTFSRLWRSLERFNIALLPQLQWYYTRQGVPLDIAEDLLHEFSLCGLLTVSLEQSGLINGSAGYRHSRVGKIFLEVGFGIRSGT